MGDDLAWGDDLFRDTGLANSSVHNYVEKDLQTQIKAKVKKN